MVSHKIGQCWVPVHSLVSDMHLRNWHPRQYIVIITAISESSSTPQCSSSLVLESSERAPKLKKSRGLSAPY